MAIEDILLLRVGLDSSSGRGHGPLFEDNSFEYIPIPESSETREERTYDELLARTGGRFSEHVPHLAERLPHFDPEFEHRAEHPLTVAIDHDEEVLSHLVEKERIDAGDLLRHARTYGDEVFQRFVFRRPRRLGRVSLRLRYEFDGVVAVRDGTQERPLGVALVAVPVDRPRGYQEGVARRHRVLLVVHSDDVLAR